MNLRIRRRHVLVLAIASIQAVCLCWGVFLFASWLKSPVRQVIHDQVLADNVQTAKQMMRLIAQMDVSDLRSNRQSWERLQNTVRDIRLPNEGYVCVIDKNDGQLLCHPALRKAPKVLLQNLGFGSADLDISDMMQKKERIPKSETHPASEEVQGYTVENNGELEIIAAGYIPELNANVNVHQKASGIENNIARMMKPIIPIGLTVSLGLVLVTTSLVIALMQWYDNRLLRINEKLEEMVDQRTRSLRKTRDGVIFGLAKLAESRDTDTGEHLDRIRTYVTILGKYLSKSVEGIDKKFIENLSLASSLHDIGKVGIPDAILLKPGRFEPEERTVMETHAQLGGECLTAIGKHLGEDDFLEMSREIAFFHHEKWDGTGYPTQIRGEAIPLSSRIVALADVYDALRSKRPYKEPMPHEKAKQIILEGNGTHFDPQLIDAFLACEEEFYSVSEASLLRPTPCDELEHREHELELANI